MSAEVEAITVELDGLGDPADRPVGLEDRRGTVEARVDVRGGQTRRPAAEDCGADGPRIRLGRQLARRPHVRLDLCDPGSQLVDERRWLVFVELDGDSAPVE